MSASPIDKLVLALLNYLWEVPRSLSRVHRPSKFLKTKNYYELISNMFRINNNFSPLYLEYCFPKIKDMQTAEWCNQIGTVFVVLDSIKEAFRDKKKYFIHEYKKQICSDFYNTDINFIKFTQMHTNIREALKHNFMGSLLKSAVFP